SSSDVRIVRNVVRVEVICFITKEVVGSRMCTRRVESVNRQAVTDLPQLLRILITMVTPTYTWRVILRRAFFTTIRRAADSQRLEWLQEWRLTKTAGSRRVWGSRLRTTMKMERSISSKRISAKMFRTSIRTTATPR